MNAILNTIARSLLVLGLVFLVSSAALAVENGATQEEATEIICVTDIEQMLDPAEDAVARARAAGQEDLAGKAQNALDRARVLAGSLNQLEGDCFEEPCEEVVSRLTQDNVKQALLYAAAAELIAAGEPAEILIEQADLNEDILDRAFNCATSLVYEGDDVREEIDLTEGTTGTAGDEVTVVEIDNELFDEENGLSRCLCLASLNDELDQLAFVGIGDADILAAGPAAVGGPGLVVPPTGGDGPEIFTTPTPPGGLLPPPETASGP